MSSRLEICCTKCGWSQYEPLMVVSTNCRSCGHHMDVEDGKVVDRSKENVAFKPSNKPPIEHPVVAPKEKEAATSKKEGVGFFAKLFERSVAKKAVNCFRCGNDFDVVRGAQSTQCPKCGGYIGLDDHVIDQPWPKRIETRGDVLILKEGSIVGLDVCCHDLVVIGKLSASASCSGKLVIRSSGRILGDLKCAELRIEKGARVEIQGKVETGSAYIDGELRAQIFSKGTIRLAKRAHLQGTARAGSLVLGKRARHTGAMEIVK